MRQLTETEAIALARSGEWKDWTDEEIVRFQLFQNLLCVSFIQYHLTLEAVLGRSIWMHEFIHTDLLRAEYLGEKELPTWDEIIGMIPAEKLIILGIEP